MSDLHLTKCELEVMEAVWKLGRATVQDVCDNMERDLAYTTVMTTLKILEEKRGVLSRTKEGRAFVYEPTVSRDEVQRQMTGELTRRLFGGSAKSLMMSLLGQRQISRSDIAELRQAIESLEQESET